MIDFVHVKQKMFVSALLVSVACAAHGGPAGTLQELPVFSGPVTQPVKKDWLVTPVHRTAGVYRSSDGKTLVMTNGLIRREWKRAPNAATVSYDNLMLGQTMLRGVKPEAVVELDGRSYDVGGLLGQPDYAYLRPEWLDRMTASSEAFQFAGLAVGRTEPRFAWKRVRYSSLRSWPPPGASLTLRFVPPSDALHGLQLDVHYEMFDGIPLLAKWLTIRNGTGRAVMLNRFVSEVLAVVDYESTVERPSLPPDVLHIESDYAFRGMDARGANHTAYWVPDPQYSTQVNFMQQSPVQLESRPPLGPAVVIAPGETWQSFRTFELTYDSSDRERRGLALRRMYRTIAPWVTENPIMMHVRLADPESVRHAVDQCAEVGFEMVIMSFGSGFNMENEDPAYLAQIKTLVDYARAKGVELGGYSLLASRAISPEDDVINPQTGAPDQGAIFRRSPCLCSRWGQDYFRKLKKFIEFTGLSLLEQDGPYPGELCGSRSHPGHRGLEDSQWRQWKANADFYQWCRVRGVYLNAPDWYFLSGSNKAAMGYLEGTWSLPRERQVILGRQNIYDGTWEKTPSMGWMFVPLVQYGGGGAAATLEPLHDHLDVYAHHLIQNFGAGVQACYRGPRLYDAEETKAVVKKWVAFYKRHRAILDSDIVHLKRPDGRQIDAILHVNAGLKEKGLAMVYNPLDETVSSQLRLPLYYTGLTQSAWVREQDGRGQLFKLSRNYEIEVSVKIPAHGYTWIVIESPAQ